MYVLVAIKKGKVKVISSSSETGDLTKELEMCFLFWVKDKPKQIDVFYLDRPTHWSEHIVNVSAQ